MAVKAIFALCASVLLAKTAFSQCIGRAGFAGLPYDGIAHGVPVSHIGYGCNDINLAASYGGGLAVTSSSPIAPTGLIVNSENAIDGTLSVIGNLPFLGSVALEGVFPTAGAGAVSYGCGDGFIGIISELPVSGPAVTAPAGYASLAPLGYLDGYNVAPYGGCGCGYSPIYY